MANKQKVGKIREGIELMARGRTVGDVVVLVVDSECTLYIHVRLLQFFSTF